jgi:Predicted transcriptional regulators
VGKVELAKNIVKYRKRNKLSQEQLAEALNISRQSISKWETGENLPSIDNLISLSGLLDISLDELITGEPYLHFPFDYGKPKIVGHR